MNGSMPPCVTIRPLAKPQAAPTTIDSVTATAMSRIGFARRPVFRNRMSRLATKATIEPTDRSRPPAVITNVAPTAITAINALCVATFRRLPTVRKRSLDRAPRTRRNASATKGATARRSIRDHGRIRPRVPVSRETLRALMRRLLAWSSWRPPRRRLLSRAPRSRSRSCARPPPRPRSDPHASPECGRRCRSVPASRTRRR